MNEAIRRADPSSEYELLQRVGSGSYGEVYKARDLSTGEFAAVKIVKLETGDNFAAIQQEIVVLKDCVHPNIISYFGSYLKRDRLWIVMEYCGGGSLQDIYQMTGPLTELQIAFVCRETLNGLRYLHHRGKVHRDVKGANILLTHAGDVKLADFGIAAQITATLGKRMSFIGSPYWMAPEVANVEHSGGYGSECDVWAVGITAIELAEMKPPYYELQPMQALYQMTKSSYKIPKLKDKKKWSVAFAHFVKCCLTKNPKKRPSPARLLNNDPFVCGALSSRLTRELLDRVNHPERAHESPTALFMISPPSPPTSDERFSQNGQHPQEEQHEFVPLPNRRSVSGARRIEFGVVGASSSSNGSSKECLNSSCCCSDNDEVFGTPSGKPSKQQSYHSERTLLAQSHGDDEEHDNTLQNMADESAAAAVGAGKKKRGEKCSSRDDQDQVQRVAKRRPNDLRGLLPRTRNRPVSSVSEQPVGSPSRANRLLSRIDESFRVRWLKLRSKSSSMLNVGFYTASPDQVSPGRKWPPAGRQHQHYPAQPFQPRPMTCCFGMVPTPQVTMGACFVTVLHQASIHVNFCAQWFHPANQKQFMIIGAEQGIFALDLSDMTCDEGALIQLHERRCTWLYVVGDTITALQGKTPYLYRHEMLQLFQQELIQQKLAKQLDRLPQGLKPKALLSTIRMPETRDCYQCSVERSINDGQLYLCCAVPNAVLLFRWYEPLSRFVWLKRMDLDKLSTPCTGPHAPHRPFNLIFGSSANNSDYPMVCIGISRALTSPVGTAQELLHELMNKPQKDKLELQLVDFNETAHGNARDLYAAASGLYGDDTSDEENQLLGCDRAAGAFASPRSTGSLRTIWRWREKLENVVALRQLDRDTLFIAYDKQIVLTDLSGAEKKTDLMQTAFSFDFRLDYAIPLSDSVLAFHKHGMQGKSFFRGAVTQDLCEPNKLYQLVGRDSLVVLKTMVRRRPTLLDDSLPLAQNVAQQQQQETNSCDLCVLSGHVSTMTPP